MILLSPKIKLLHFYLYLIYQIINLIFFIIIYIFSIYLTVLYNSAI